MQTSLNDFDSKPTKRARRWVRRKVLSLNMSLSDEHCVTTLLRAQLGLTMFMYAYHGVCTIRTHLRVHIPKGGYSHWADHCLSVINKTLHNHREWVAPLCPSFWQMAPTKVCLGQSNKQRHHLCSNMPQSNCTGHIHECLQWQMPHMGPSVEPMRSA